MDYLDLARRNIPVQIVRAIERMFPEAYEIAFNLAESTFEGNVSVHCGLIRWGLCDDALYKAAIIAGMNVKRVYASNGQTHTEVYTDEGVIIQKKVDEPGTTGNATYKRLLAENNGQLSLFDLDDLDQLVVAEDKPVLFEITHSPFNDDRSKVEFIHVVIPSEDDILAHFPLSTLYPNADDKGGIEEVPDIPPILPKPDAQAGT